MVVDLKNIPSKKVRCDLCNNKFFYKDLNRLNNSNLMYCNDCYNTYLSHNIKVDGDKKLIFYLKKTCWTAEELKKFISQNETVSDSLFKGMVYKNLLFNKNKFGEKYIQIIQPTKRFYLRELK